MAKKSFSDLRKQQLDPTIDQAMYDGAPLSDDVLSQLKGLSKSQSDSPPENALVVTEDGLSRQYKRITLEPTHLILPDDLTRDEWLEIGMILMQMQSSIQWLLGDWINAMKTDWQNAYEAIAARFGYEVESLWSYASVCRKIPALTRVKDLSFSHHRAVTQFADEPDLMQTWLNRAKDEGWSAKELVRQIKDESSRAPVLPPAVKKVSGLESYFSPRRWRNLPDDQRERVLTRLKVLVQQLEEMS